MGDDQEQDPRAGPLSERIVNKNWKIRMYAYEDLEKEFKSEVNDKAPIYAEYGKNMGKYVVDKNAPAQEKALDAYLAFLDRAHKDFVHKIAPSVSPKLVDSTFGQRMKNKNKGVEAILLHVEVDAPVESVVEALVAGGGGKQPKVAAVAIGTLKEVVSCFGAKYIPLKSIVKALPVWFEKKDKNTRAETFSLTIELYRWVGDKFVGQLEGLRGAQMKELEAAFEGVKGEGVKMEPKRLLRSKNPEFGGRAVGVAGGEEEEEVIFFFFPFLFLLSFSLSFFLTSSKNTTRKKKRKKILMTLLPRKPKKFYRKSPQPSGKELKKRSGL